LEQLIRSPQLRAEQGAKGLAHVREHYSMQVYRADYLALLSRLAAR
jgi:hypothetical protein